MRFGAVIFDSDGTLVDSEVLANEVLVEYAAHFGIALAPAESLALFRGARMADSVEQLAAIRGAPLPDTFVPEFRRLMMEAFSRRLKPIAGALELVSTLAGPIGVASNGPRDKLVQSLSVTGLLPHFDSSRIFSAYDVGIWKPDPGLYLHAADAMKARPADCAVVEDSLPGISAALAAGMTVFALQLDSPDPRIPAGVRIIRSLLELHDIL